MNRIINPCETVLVGEQEYKINTDFVSWIEIGDLLIRSSAYDQNIAAKILRLAYPVLPHVPVLAFEKVLWFYNCGETVRKSGVRAVTKIPKVNLKDDFPYIWAAFMSDFGIDLSVQKLHWWKFRALLESLSDNCKFSRIVSYRSVNVSELKDKNMRIFYDKMKKKYQLNDVRTSREREQETVLTLEKLF